MKLLILTQKVDINDSVLGFFHRWLEEFTKHCEKVLVICLEKGEFSLPANVKVLSLGKEEGKNRLKYICRFYKYIWQERKKYDVIFVHMNPEYILLGGCFWKLLGKKIGLWYAHGHVNWILRVAEKIVDMIFTSTKSGCRLDSSKIKVVGQGIDVDFFKPAESSRPVEKFFKIVSIGRLSPAKDYPTLIKAAKVLSGRGRFIKVDIIGATALPSEGGYLNFLKNMVEENGLGGVVIFLGEVANAKIPPYLQASDLFVNMSHTGSLDKAIVEAMAVGLPVLTCNEALEEVLGDYVNILMYPKGDFWQLAEKIDFIINLSPDRRRVLSSDLREIVVKNHSVQNFVGKINDYLLID